MVDTILIVLCIISADRFRTAEEKGVANYIVGVGCAVICTKILSELVVVQFDYTLDFILIGIIVIIGYILAFYIVYKALRKGRELMEARAINERHYWKAALNDINQQHAANIESIRKELEDIKSQARFTADR